MIYNYVIQKSALKFTAPFTLAIKKKFQIALKATTPKITFPLKITWTSTTNEPTQAVREGVLSLRQCTPHQLPQCADGGVVDPPARKWMRKIPHTTGTPMG